jgi:hypothetical protein
MMGLMVLGVLVVYLLVSAFVTKKAADWAKANNKKPWVWGGLAAFMMYNLVFWDLIPTLVMHKYYCSTQAGFWVYKTPEQWLKENPELTKEDLKTDGELDSWVSGMKPQWRFPRKPLESNPKRNFDTVNKRIYLDSDYERNISKFLPISKFTNTVVDAKNNEKLSQLTTYGSGYPSAMTSGGFSGFKTWLKTSNCSGLNFGEDADSAAYNNFINKIVGLARVGRNN